MSVAIHIILRPITITIIMSQDTIHTIIVIQDIITIIETLHLTTQEQGLRIIQGE